MAEDVIGMDEMDVMEWMKNERFYSIFFNMNVYILITWKDVFQ
jgi:hypothetical protein